MKSRAVRKSSQAKERRGEYFSSPAFWFLTPKKSCYRSHMAKLHELLAVDSNLKVQADKTRTELRNTFEKKRHLFAEKKIVTTPMTEGAQQTTEVQSEIQTTVAKELDWISGHIAKALDVTYQIGVANQSAKADVVLEDGTVLLKDVPATVLLDLEKRVKEMMDLIQTIPTLDPAKGFVEDSARGKGYFRARDISKTRTQKVQKPLVLYPATPEHPAQTQLVSVDEPVARLDEQEWSSCITVAAKGDLYDNAEAVLRAVKKARSRANDITVDTTAKIGAVLTKAVFGV